MLEFEQLMQVFFGDAGTTEDLRRNLAAARAWAHERTLVNIDVGRSYLADDAPFPERAALNMVVGRFLDDFLETIDRWAVVGDRDHRVVAGAARPTPRRSGRAGRDGRPGDGADRTPAPKLMN